MATPGRLMDFVSNCVVCLDELRYLVLDEADRMLTDSRGGDEGFLKELNV